MVEVAPLDQRHHRSQHRDIHRGFHGEEIATATLVRPWPRPDRCNAPLMRSYAAATVCVWMRIRSPSLIFNSRSFSTGPTILSRSVATPFLRRTIPTVSSTTGAEWVRRAALRANFDIRPPGRKTHPRLLWCARARPRRISLRTLKRFAVDVSRARSRARRGTYFSSHHWRAKVIHTIRSRCSGRSLRLFSPIKK